MRKKAKLIFFCGKMGAGKSTESKLVAQQQNAVLLSEDDWLSKLYPNKMASFKDYLNYSAILKPLVKAHVIEILRAGANVVMDFPANTKKQRCWFKAIATEAEAYSQMVYLDVSNEQCLNQIAQRRIKYPERARFDTEAVFNEVNCYFEAPLESEGLNIRKINVQELTK